MTLADLKRQIENIGPDHDTDEIIVLASGIAFAIAEVSLEHLGELDNAPGAILLITAERVHPDAVLYLPTL